jgi:DNA-directed RNA polymerase subunit beta'
MTGIPSQVDAGIVQKLLQGELAAIEVDGEVVSRGKILRQILNELVYGKGLLEYGAGRDGNEIVLPRRKVNHQILEALAGVSPESLTVRPLYRDDGDPKRTHPAGFLHPALREEPMWRFPASWNHQGALATDSFLSAESFPADSAGFGRRGSEGRERSAPRS